MPKRLNESWLEQVSTLAQNLNEIADLNFYVDFEVAETPEGKFRAHTQFINGVPSSLKVGKLDKKTLNLNADDPIVTISVKAKRFAKFIDVSTSIPAAFMRGEITIGGDYEYVVDYLFSKADRQSWETLRKNISAITTS